MGRLPAAGCVLLVAASVALATAVLIWNDYRIEAEAVERQNELLGPSPDTTREVYLENEERDLREAGWFALAIGVGVGTVLMGTGIPLIVARGGLREQAQPKGTKRIS